MTPPHIQQKKASEIFEGENSSLRKTFDKAVHICCDGECNHYDCCGKVKENCPNYSKETNRPDLHPAPTQPEWMKEFDIQFAEYIIIGSWRKNIKDFILSTIQKEIEKVNKKYQELLYAVARKFPDETRHETALRYINEAEVAALCSSPTVVEEK